MPMFNVDWEVNEVVVGPGQHSDGVREGDRNRLGYGEMQKEADSEDDLRDKLTRALKEAFPPVDYGPTYNLERSYDINISKVGD